MNVAAAGSRRIRRSYPRVVLAVVLACALSGITEAAPVTQQRSLERVSLTAAGAEIPADSYAGAIAEHGLAVAFMSGSSAVVPNDTNDAEDVFVRTLAAGQVATTRVSVGATAVQGNGDSENIAIDASGTRVAFQSLADNLVAGDDNGVVDVFVRDTGSAATLRASVATSGVSANGNSYLPTISADGRTVAFVSLATNLASGDASAHVDVFVRDLEAGTTELVSVGIGGGPADGDSTNPALSSDGRYVAFESNATNLVPGDANGTWDVFVHDRLTGQTACASVSQAAVPANGASHNASLGAHGDLVAFDSVATDIVPGDLNGKSDVFVRDLHAGSTAHVSRSRTGSFASGDSQSPSMCADGRFVAFISTAEDLTFDAANGYADAFVWDRDAGGAVVLLSTASGGVAGNGDTGDVVLSPDGRFAAFHSTASNLVAADTNLAADVFVTEFAPRSIERVAGATRYATAVEASKNSYPADGSADSVVLATGRNWPDALGGAALAGALGAPLLLCDTNTLPADVGAEIERLGADTVYILGGEAAVSAGVYSAAGELTGVDDVVRIAGATRYETAQQVAEAVHAIDPAAASTVFVATGRNFPDALAASPVSAATRWPILLADPARGVELPAYVTDAVLLGGTSVVPASIESALRSELGAANVERWWGANRYATAVDVASHAVARTSLRYDDVTIATGERFPDALSGGVMAGTLGGVLLLTPTAVLRTEPASALASNRDAIASAWIMGGEAAVSSAVMTSVKTALGE